MKPCFHIKHVFWEFHVLRVFFEVSHVFQGFKSLSNCVPSPRFVQGRGRSSFPGESLFVQFIFPGSLFRGGFSAPSSSSLSIFFFSASTIPPPLLRKTERGSKFEFTTRRFNYPFVTDTPLLGTCTFKNVSFPLLKIHRIGLSFFFLQCTEYQKWVVIRKCEPWGETDFIPHRTGWMLLFLPFLLGGLSREYSVARPLHAFLVVLFSRSPSFKWVSFGKFQFEKIRGRGRKGADGIQERDADRKTQYPERSNGNRMLWFVFAGLEFRKLLLRITFLRIQ